MFKKVNIPILGLIQNMSYLEMEGDKKYIFGKNGVLAESKEQKIKFLGDIPIIAEITKAGDDGDPLTSKKNSSLNSIFEKISDELILSIAENKNNSIEINN